MCAQRGLVALRRWWALLRRQPLDETLRLRKLSLERVRTRALDTRLHEQLGGPLALALALADLLVELRLEGHPDALELLRRVLRSTTRSLA